jgi:hypothetical protein
VADHFQATPLGKIQAKGKFKPVNAFSVTGQKTLSE